MVKVQAKYLLTICIFLICGYSSVFAKTHTQYKQTVTGSYIFVNSIDEIDYLAQSTVPTVSFEHQKKHASLEAGVFEVEEYEEILSLKKPTATPALYHSFFFDFIGESVFHCRQNPNFIHTDTLYPSLERYILLQVFRI